MTALGIDIDLAADFLEDTLAAQAEIECEAQHDELPPEFTCSITVTHRAMLCIGSGLICSEAARYGLEAIPREAAGNTCPFCGKPAVDCWRVIPV